MIWLALAACGGGAATPADLAPEPVGLQECAVCGMVVGEQPSPHGQVAYRDGTHALTCSLGDLRALIQTPSPLGPPVQVWVEAMGPDLDAQGPLPWIPAADATYVSGVPRPLVMGLPLLSYADAATAERVAAEHDGHVHTWQAVHDTPFSEVPR